jgi:glyoxylase-like metal-dependent hydrolase (beta-lactamase superfamily II)
MVTKQEQEPASDEIVEVAPGILRMQLPIQFTGLGHVNCYALVDDRGVALVDPGLPGEESWAGLTDRLARADIPLARVHTVIVTHSHPDHFGGAARLRDETGADILTHQSFRLFWERGDDLDDTPSDALESPEDWSRPTPWGTEFRPPSEGAMTSMRTEMRTGRHTPRPTRRVDDAEVVRFAGREWVSMHTPGHTHDHLCLFDPTDGILLSGDHVLPTITPHIGGVGADGRDPLAEFFGSLERVAALDGVRLALPAHGHPFTDVAGRVESIERHHGERLDRLRTASVEFGGFGRVEEYMRHLFSERVWGSMAESETYAHLEHLRSIGRATTEWRDGLLHFRVDEVEATAS